jgi:hypothetical protein
MRSTGESRRREGLPRRTSRCDECSHTIKALPYLLEHADALEQQLERHGPDEPRVRLSLTDDVSLRFSNWARWQLGIPLPVEG